MFVKIEEDYDSCTLCFQVELSLFLSAEGKGHGYRAEGMRRVREALKQPRKGTERADEGHFKRLLLKENVNHKSRVAPSLVRLHTPQHCSKAIMWN